MVSIVTSASRQQSHCLPCNHVTMSPWETTQLSVPVYGGVDGLGGGAGPDDVMKLDTTRRGSNRMGDEDGRRYNDQVLTCGPLDPNLTPRHEDEKRRLSQTPWVTNARALADARAQKPARSSYCSEINEHRRDQAWISV